VNAKRLLWITALASSSCASSLVVHEQVLDQAAARQLRCLAVLPFANATSTTAAGDLVANAVAQTMFLAGDARPLTPDEALHLLNVAGVPYGAQATPASGQLYGQAMGVDGVIMGTVTEMGVAPGGNSTKGPIVGFVASLVSAATGKALWTTAASNYHHAVWLESNEPRDILLRDMMGAALRDLLATTSPTEGATRPPCAAAIQAELRKP
jgi:hypothetical protein